MACRYTYALYNIYFIGSNTFTPPRTIATAYRLPTYCIIIIY